MAAVPRPPSRARLYVSDEIDANNPDYSSGFFSLTKEIQFSKIPSRDPSKTSVYCFSPLTTETILLVTCWYLPLLLTPQQNRR
jgi:hypothetical protein